MDRQADKVLERQESLVDRLAGRVLDQQVDRLGALEQVLDRPEELEEHQMKMVLLVQLLDRVRHRQEVVVCQAGDGELRVEGHHRMREKSRRLLMLL